MNFRSLAELGFSEMLKEKNIDYDYEKLKITLLEPYNGLSGAVRGSIYTPDFTFVYKGRKIVIEIKGYLYGKALASFYYKRAGWECEKMDTEFYMVQYVSKRKNFYLWKDRDIALRDAETPTIWERINID